MSIFNYFPQTLSPDQKAAIEKIELFLSSDVNCFLLKGYAGTGKTFLMQGLVKYFAEKGREHRLMAPTGRAAMVIGNKTETDAYTIHKSIYNLKEFEDDEVSFKCKYKLNENIHSTDTIYIVDESSMISDIYNEDDFFIFGSGYLLKDLIEYADFINRKQTKIIFIGDNAQLPPIGMSFSPALSINYLKDKYNITSDEYEMKDVYRQKYESGILENATKLRESLAKNRYNTFEIQDFNDAKNIATSLFDNIYSEITGNNVSENTIIITHSNKQAYEYNVDIRKKFFPEKKDLCKGDILINTRNNYNYAVELYNGQFLKVIEVAEYPEPPVPVRFKQKGGQTAEVTFLFRNAVVEVSNFKGEKHTLNCKIIDNFLNNDYPRLTKNEQQALYVNFKERNKHLKPGTREFKDALKQDKYFNALQVKYGYAITCHKAQGGEWNNVFVDLRVFMRILSKGFLRWAYTAITRAKKQLYAINSISYSPITEYIVKDDISKITRLHANQYYIPDEYFSRVTEMEFSEPFLKAKYVELTEKLKNENIKFSVIHNNWVERYTFSKNENFAIIDLYYNNEGFTGKFSSIRNNDEKFLKTIIETISEPIIIEFEYTPPNEFQKVIYNYLKEISNETDVKITNIANENNLDRYYLRTDAKCAYVDCIYDQRGVYTKINGHSTDGNQDIKLNTFLNNLL